MHYVRLCGYTYIILSPLLWRKYQVWKFIFIVPGKDCKCRLDCKNGKHDAVQCTIKYIFLEWILNPDAIHQEGMQSGFCNPAIAIRMMPVGRYSIPEGNNATFTSKIVRGQTGSVVLINIDIWNIQEVLQTGLGKKWTTNSDSGSVELREVMMQCQRSNVLMFWPKSLVPPPPSLATYYAKLTTKGK